MDRIDRRLVLLIRIAVVPGFLAASYLTYAKIFDKTIACATGGCEIIEASKWSELFGIPVTLLGMITYVLLFSSTFVKTDEGKLAGAFLAVCGAAFSGWLQYQALFVMEHLCPWCLTSAICMWTLAILTITRVVRVPGGDAFYDDADDDAPDVGSADLVSGGKA